MKTISDVISDGRFREAPGPQPAPAIIEQCLPTCPVCGGVGLVRYNVPFGHELFGKLAPCPNLPSNNRHVLTACGLHLDDIDAMTWDAIRPEPLTGMFKGKGIPTDARRVANSVRDYLAKGDGLIYLCGAYGLGKSHIAKTATAERVRQGLPALYVQANDILDDIKAGYDTHDPSESAAARLTRYRAHPWLVIDEYDKVQDTPWVEVALFRIIDARYDLAIHKLATTIIVSNLRPESLSDALASRVRDGRFLVIELDGQDVRPKMERQ
jgi:DNA replication protein DnaC